ncbi:hypothetical protein [Pseudofrankia sp. BMG5.36]|uniref:hypothetical protein n=1 Tax=Pseudofrankia sp. BMG5.36 TaxID=1834512 RepID=UPI0008DA7D15|nr:hypothetical protein [Pseudofrankia sp. BMG5.36]OHV57965.1 hypothetical protein BCD48_42755 [Pseudofrankia sp. BMG5.36]
MSAMMIELDGSDAVPVPVTVAPVPLPRRPGVLVDVYPRPEFVRAGWHPPDSVASQLAQENAARVLVACPALVSPASSRLALAVARILADQRDALHAGPQPVVTCGVRPRCGWEGGGVIVPHPVTVFIRGTAQYRVVWEVTRAEQIPAWRAGLARVPALSDV